MSNNISPSATRELQRLAAYTPGALTDQHIKKSPAERGATELAIRVSLHGHFSKPTGGGRDSTNSIGSESGPPNSSSFPGPNSVRILPQSSSFSHISPSISLPPETTALAPITTMPDIDPAALSRPLISSTPILPPKTLSSAAPSAQKVSKTSHVPPRIDLEPLYTALKAAIGDNWSTYKDAFGLFVLGHLNQAELSRRINWFLESPTGEIEHLHNQLIAAIYGNVTREMPDPGVASWVSANDKPTSGAGSKPVSGDAAEQRLKFEVMQLPSRDRRRLKDIAINEPEFPDALASLLGEHRRAKILKGLTDAVPASAGGLNKTNWDLEIRKRYAQPLAAESGEFPDTSTVESRMLPICYETGLVSGHTPDAAQFMSVATETFVKQFLSSVFDKTRSNGPGAGGSAGSGGGAGWIMTEKYRAQLGKEEELWLRAEIQRDKSGLLPVEAKAASERGPLGMADLRTALEVGDCGLGSMALTIQKVMSDYREGELDGWNDYTKLSNGRAVNPTIMDVDVVMGGANGTHTNGTNGINGSRTPNGVNGFNGHQEDDSDVEGYGWEGSSSLDRQSLNNLLDSCLS